MIQYARFILFISLVFSAVSCGESKKDGEASLNDKKVALQKLRDEQRKRTEEIRKLEEEIAKIDTSVSVSTRTKLVAYTAAVVQEFNHYVDLQGRIDAENISYVSPRGMGGQVKAVYVKEGQRVRKGQLLLKLDDAVMQQQVTAARQQLAGIRTQLDFARNIYERQNNLWKQGIGTEVQLIQARTNMEGLEDQLRSANEQVKVAQEQANTANVYSDVDGIADVVNIRVGEAFTGMSATGPQIKIVNTGKLKAMSSIPENYISKFSVGTPVEVQVPDLNKTFSTKLSRVSQSIDPSLRGFVVEAPIPSDPMLKPNQTAVLRILDYANPKAVVIPVNAVQSDETGKYVFIAMQQGERTVARKVMVTPGEAYGNLLEVKSGLKGGEQIITDGFQDLYDGQSVSDKVL